MGHRAQGLLTSGEDDVTNANYVNFLERTTDPPTPGTGRWLEYFRAGGAYLINDSGTVVPPLVYNVLAYAKAGDSDDTAAIRRAIDAMPQVSLPARSDGGAVLFFPPKNYTVSSEIALPQCITIRGTPGSLISANVAGYIFSRNPSGGNLGPIVIEGLKLKNTGSGGGCIYIANQTLNLLRNLNIAVNDGVGIDLRLNDFTSRVANCHFQSAGSNHPAGQIGVLASSHALIEACDIQGLTTGVVAYGTQVSILGCRMEVNTTAIQVGIEADLTTDHVLTDGLIAGNTFEANDTGIYLHHAGNLHVTTLHVYGTTNAPSGSSKYGIRVGTLSDSVISGVITNGNFDTAGIDLSGGTKNRVTFISCSAGNGGSGVGWNKPTDTSELAFLNCDSNTDLHLRQLSGLSGTTTQAKNLRGSVTISGAATSGAVAFTNDEADASYTVTVSASGTSGTPASGSTRAYVNGKATSGFTVNLEAAPGTGNAVTVDWQLIR